MRGDSGINWILTEATPGALNANQTEGGLNLEAPPTPPPPGALLQVR